MNEALEENPIPVGELSLQTVAMPRDTNAGGDIFGGWLVSQMDLAASVAATKIAGGRVVTVAIDNMSFLVPVQVGSIVSCYTQIMNIGRSSMQILVEVWTEDNCKDSVKTKVTEGIFVFVAIDKQGHTRAI